MSIPRGQAPVLINRLAGWKYAVLVASLVLLVLSALPTLFGDEAHLDLKAQAPVSAGQLKALLPEAAIARIQARGDSANLVLKDDADPMAAKTALEKALPGATVTLSRGSKAPSWLQEMGMAPIKLGLDLRGGVQFILAVDTQAALAAQYQAAKDALAELPALSGVQLQADGLVLHPRAGSDLGALKSLIQRQYPNWQLRQEGGLLQLGMTAAQQQAQQAQAMAQSLGIMRNRIQELGITEAAVMRDGKSRIRIEIPGVQDPARARSIIGATASLEFRQAFTEGGQGRLRMRDERGLPVWLARRPILTGSHITGARAGVDELGRPQVSIQVDGKGAERIGDFSRAHIGDAMASLFIQYRQGEDGQTEKTSKVISVARIQSALPASFRITGLKSPDQAKELALLLRAGSLSAPVTIIQQGALGPSLGKENIHNGLMALALGLGSCLLFVALWYRRFGWVANVALIANLFMLLGLMALVPGAVLTLPGIAGLVLTVGMAVDTNVLIFERIKELVREGKGLGQAIHLGYDNAFRTILDANLTTLFSALILYGLGQGPVRGFAVSLGLGLLTSMLTGILGTRAIINPLWGRDNRKAVRI
ncbi:protein translocase subunit SecD [Gallaecimonas kandeliae]|uniref:protein translocase subunit SecD n=1 Tax=Gallaecimonas kandeliae TaxID=3029055 RepID=UPI002647BA3A|nr:protein translocase subunit SecD [Gallaecimonas kandeliae]WKE67030.1 protein translocase subunit SecD [Gallaecimonas kandeliae]